MKKLNFEIERLDNVMLSIKNGFIPEKFEGYPRGYFILNTNEDWVFYIVGGSHRVALVALNFEYIPVILQPTTQVLLLKIKFMIGQNFR